MSLFPQTSLSPPPPFSQREVTTSSSGYGICYNVHIQNIGWQGWRCNGAMAGTTGESLRIEALAVHVLMPHNRTARFCIRGHIQNIGWQGMRCERLDYYGGEYGRDLVIGTTGQALRLEAVRFSFMNCYCADLRAVAHVQNIGWQQPFVGDDITIGTTGQSLRFRGCRAPIDQLLNQIWGNVNEQITRS